MSTRKMRSPAHLHKLADMISIDQLTKVYGEGENATVVLDRLDFTVKTGEIFAVVGASEGLRFGRGIHHMHFDSPELA